MSETQQIKENPPSVSVGLLSVIEKVAINPDLDVDKLQQMLDLQERVMIRQAEMDFNADMAKLRAKLPSVLKNKDNTQTSSRYADLEAIKVIVDPLLTEFGFYDRYEDDFPSPGIVGTTCEIVHTGGHSKKNRVEFVLDSSGIKGTVNKTPIHAAASSMTYGQRISLCRALGIRFSNDQDGNSAPAACLTDEQIAFVTSLIAQSGADEKRFLAWIGAENIAGIKAKDFQKAVTALQSRKKGSTK